jgi:ectoine hydroxylase-related dioxygenase (phytanoyl-CoA dioxygenase family)
LERLMAEGSLEPDTEVDAAKPRAGVEFCFRPDLANENREVLDLLYSERVMAFFGGMFGEPAMHYDYTWLRAMSPGMNTYPHFDIVYMGRGTDQIFTLWCPLGDVHRTHGGLMILEGSHRIDWLREHYGSLDVDTFCENHPGVRQTDHHGFPFGAFSFDPVEVRARFGARWLTADYRAGDLLIFSMYTMHASLDNQHDRIRISTDSRYQPAALPADERWIGEHPIAHGENARVGLIC